MTNSENRSSVSLSNWFQYSDRDDPPYNPVSGTNITVERFFGKSIGDVDSKDWLSEEWLIQSALFPVEQLVRAAAEITSNQIAFELGWNSEDKFSFGDSSRYNGMDLFPFSLLIRHPISKKVEVELSRKFRIYHALEKRNETQYFHPIDNIKVAEVSVESYSYFDPSAKVILHSNYLRDFLAVVNLGLIITIVADRFANALTKEELQLEPTEYHQIDDLTWLITRVASRKSAKDGYFQGRSTLRRNIIVHPYEKPSFERNPWVYFGGSKFHDEQFPAFIINGEGEKRTLSKNTYLPNYISQGIGEFGYLYFRPEVLQKYLNTPGYNVYFHMRTWGVASHPGGRGKIDVGINSQGLVNAFAPDIADLSPSEQGYWASFSSLPSGEVCQEMFQTRMQLKPPRSPGVVELIQGARDQIASVILDEYLVGLFNNIELSANDRNRLSVGPVTNQLNELFDLAKVLYGRVVETIQIDALRIVLEKIGGTVDPNWRQIKLLEKILIAKGLNETEAKLVTASLAGLNELRIRSAHVSNQDVESAFQKMGASTMPSTIRAAWNLCVDSVVESLSKTTSQLVSN